MGSAASCQGIMKNVGGEFTLVVYVGFCGEELVIWSKLSWRGGALISALIFSLFSGLLVFLFLRLWLEIVFPYWNISRSRCVFPCLSLLGYFF